MIGDVSLFINLTWKEKGYVKFGDEDRDKIIASGTIGYPLHSIENVSLAKGLKHNLLSISQLYDRGYKMIFERQNVLNMMKMVLKCLKAFKRRTFILLNHQIRVLNVVFFQ